MSYQTGSATSSTDLVKQLVTWLVSLGWTQDRSAVEGSGWTASLHHNGNYVHLRAGENEAAPWHAVAGSTPHYSIQMYTGTAFDSSQPFNNQAGGPLGSSTYPVGVGAQTTAGPFPNYYFFADSTADNIVVVLEKTPGLYVHIGWGLSLQKAGSYTGGPYFFGSCAGYWTFSAPGANIPGFTISSDCPGVNAGPVGGGVAFVRADVDSWTGKWIGITAATTVDAGYTGKAGDASVHGKNAAMLSNFPIYASSVSSFQFQNEQTSEQDGRANLLPLYLWVLRDGTTTGFSMLGTVPNVFATNAVGNGFSNADEYVLGGTTYKIFPNFAVVKQ
jgi:hypothetical protein